MAATTPKIPIAWNPPDRTWAVHVNDLQATILHCLGLDRTRLTFRQEGRDFRPTDVRGVVVRARRAETRHCK